MGLTLPSAGPRMPSPAGKEAARRGPRERTGKGSREERAKGPPAAEPPARGWALSLEGLAAMRPPQRRRHLLFGDLLEDVGTAASIFPRESVELGYRMPDPRAWTQSLEPPAVRQDLLLGVLKAAEARGRIRALRLRYIRMRVRPGAGRKGRAGGKVAGQAEWGDRPRSAEERSVWGWVKRRAGPARAPRRRGRAEPDTTTRRLRNTPDPHPATRRRRRSRSSSCSRSPRAPPSGWSCSCRRS